MSKSLIAEYYEKPSTENPEGVILRPSKDVPVQVIDYSIRLLQKPPKSILRVEGKPSYPLANSVTRISRIKGGFIDNEGNRFPVPMSLLACRNIEAFEYDERWYWVVY